jgi:hypothetical protein
MNVIGTYLLCNGLSRSAYRFHINQKRERNNLQSGDYRVAGGRDTKLFRCHVKRAMVEVSCAESENSGLVWRSR